MTVDVPFVKFRQQGNEYVACQLSVDYRSKRTLVWRANCDSMAKG